MSLFYNLRLGAFGPLKGGETLRVAVLPTPEPRELVFRIGPESSEGRKIMLEVKGPKSEAEAGPYFAYLHAAVGAARGLDQSAVLREAGGAVAQPRSNQARGLAQPCASAGAD